MKQDLWKWAWMIGLVLGTPCLAQSFNIGAGVVNSQGLGFDEWYGSGIVETSGATDSVHYRIGLEILNAEKKNQNGWGGRVDLTLTRPLNNRVGVMAFYRPSWIKQTDYAKAAHLVGGGVAILTKGNGRWDLFAGFSHDEYKQEEFGFEVRLGEGHWCRIRAESINLTLPGTDIKQRGSRVSFMIAPRLKR